MDLFTETHSNLFLSTPNQVPDCAESEIARQYHHKAEEYLQLASVVRPHEVNFMLYKSFLARLNQYKHSFGLESNQQTDELTAQQMQSLLLLGEELVAQGSIARHCQKDFYHLALSVYELALEYAPGYQLDTQINLHTKILSVYQTLLELFADSDKVFNAYQTKQLESIKRYAQCMQQKIKASGGDVELLQHFFEIASKALKFSSLQTSLAVKAIYYLDTIRAQFPKTGRLCESYFKHVFCKADPDALNMIRRLSELRDPQDEFLAEKFTYIFQQVDVEALAYAEHYYQQLSVDLKANKIDRSGHCYILALALGALGECYRQQGCDDKAENNFKQVVDAYNALAIETINPKFYKQASFYCEKLVNLSQSNKPDRAAYYQGLLEKYSVCAGYYDKPVEKSTAEICTTIQAAATEKNAELVIENVKSLYKNCAKNTAKFKTVIQDAYADANASRQLFDQLAQNQRMIVFILQGIKNKWYNDREYTNLTTTPYKFELVIFFLQQVKSLDNTVLLSRQDFLRMLLGDKLETLRRQLQCEVSRAKRNFKQEAAEGLAA